MLTASFSQKGLNCSEKREACIHQERRQARPSRKKTRMSRKGYPGPMRMADRAGMDDANKKRGRKGSEAKVTFRTSDEKRDRRGKERGKVETGDKYHH